VLPIIEPELSKLAFVIPAVPDRLAFVRPVICADPENTPVPDSIVAAVIEPPNEISLPAIVIPSFAKLVLGTAAKPKVKVSVPAFPVMVRPCPDEEAKFKDDVVVFAIKAVPPIDAVLNELGTVNVPVVKYPASLFN
jgi:hypothetical protein